MFHIFDLDGTVRHSAWRAPTTPSGRLDFDGWLRLSTRENILRDGLLPTARLMRDLIAAGAPVAVLTACDLIGPDLDFLGAHGLLPKVVMDRSAVRGTPLYSARDGAYKVELLSRFGHSTSLRGATFYDDSADVVAAVRAMGAVNVVHV